MLRQDATLESCPVPTSGTRPALGGERKTPLIETALTLLLVLMTPLVRPFFTNGQVNLRVQSTMKNEVAFQ